MSKIIIGGHKVTAQADYSTTETKTGEYWIDGKPIYRKVYEKTGSWQSTNVEIYTDTTIDTLIDVYGSAVSSSAIFPLNRPSTAGVANQYDVFLRTDIDAYRVEIGAVATTKIIIIAEYTKTTD